MLDFLTSCFASPRKELKHSSLSSQSSAKVEECIFCNVTKANGFDVLWEDEKYIVFRDHKPASEHHLLVITRGHIGSVKSLTNDDAELVKDMERIGHARFDELGVSPTARRLGFHIPPFNSVNHLHLHVLSLPFRHAILGAVYPFIHGRPGYEKGWTWFAEVGQTVRILEKGGRVQVKAC
ncbi:HIT-like protein [Dentipellis sp. KUC8613]|nr:HIT-like protein [Dentipellis sp. KUC8613]